MSRIALVILLAAACSFAQTAGDVVTTREMDRINWMEFKETVPSKIDTVLLPTGTLEPHGVVNNGADNTAPTAMARTAPASRSRRDAMAMRGIRCD